MNIKDLDGIFVAIDEKDRIICIRKDYEDLLDVCYNFKKVKQETGLNIYNLSDKQTIQAIRYLLKWLSFWKTFGYHSVTLFGFTILFF